MNQRNYDKERRRQQRLERLGTNEPRCVVTGEGDPVVLERHHPGGRKYTEETIILNLVYHRKAEELRKEHPEEIPSPHSELECNGRLLLGIADILSFIKRVPRELIELIRQVGIRLIDSGRRSAAEDRSLTNIPFDHLPAAVRAYVPLAEAEMRKRWRQSPEPSEWTLVFDTETTTDPSQRLRFGSFQWRRHGQLERSGLFYDPAALTKAEVQTLHRFARMHQLELMIVETFVETVFYRLAYEFRAAIVGFNLPFDLSRLAVHHGSARRRPMQGGYSFQLSRHAWRPRVQVRHLSRRAAIIRFSAPPRQRTPRGMRKRIRTPVRRGFFVDVKTIASALTSRSDTLASLAEFLRVPSRKMVTEDHGRRLTPEYIEYAVNDTEVTWECFAEASQRYAQHLLTQTPIHRISSEAGIGKAYLAQMGIDPWRLAQPEFAPEITDIIMQSYFGGRCEVHLRRAVSQIAYCDFLSMYPTVCTLWDCGVG
jgi:hypothetical protein